VNILLLSPYPPFPPFGGGSMRIYQIMRGLAAHHSVTCLTFAPTMATEEALAPLREFGRVVVVRGPMPRSLSQRALTTVASRKPDMALRNASKDYIAALTELLRHEQFDVVQAESIEMAGYLDIVRALGSSSLRVLDQFNAEFLLQRRAFLTDVQRPKRWHAAGYSLAQWLKLMRYERSVMQRCDAVVAVSEEDRQTLQLLAPETRMQIAANGVDTKLFSRAAMSEERADVVTLRHPTLVFSGTMDYRPNVDAVRWFAAEVLPLIQAEHPQARLLVVGRRPAPVLQALAAQGQIVLTGEVPDARPFIAAASCYVVPMRIGGGVRLKFLEALSLEVPIVSTGMGAEGIVGLESGKHCIIAEEPAAFAQAVNNILDNQVLAQHMGAEGRILVCQQYDWQAIIPKLETLYHDVLDTPSTN
jgi:glycosyltransferase involved in cell wall biosynthesis